MKILVLLLPGIGNALTFTPTLKEIRNAYHQAQVDALVMYKGSEEVLQGNNDITNIHYFPFMKKGYIKSLIFMLKLRRQHYDICITPYPANKFQYNLINFLSGAKKRIAHNYPIKKVLSLSWLQNKRTPIDNTCHEIEENFKLLKFMDITSIPKDKKMFLALTKKDRQFAVDFIRQNKLTRPIIGFHPGSSTLAGMSLKRWPEENFARLIDLIKSYSPKASILLFGSKDEDSIKRNIASLTTSKPIIVNTETIKQSAAIIRKCDFFITNDSGLMHIAVAVNTPTLTLTGPTNEKKTVPLGHKTIYKNLSCRPCYQVGGTMKCKLKEKAKCLKLITPEEVFQVIKDLFIKKHR